MAIENMRKIEYVNSYFPTLSIEANDVGENKEVVKCDFEVKAQVRKEPKEGSYIVLVSVKERSERTPYRFEVLAVGTFEVLYEGEGPDDEFEAPEVAFNGAQILYGQIREQIAMMTSRSVYGSLFIPTYYFSSKDFIPENETKE